MVACCGHNLQCPAHSRTAEVRAPQMDSTARLTFMPSRTAWSSRMSKWLKGTSMPRRVETTRALKPHRGASGVPCIVHRSSVGARADSQAGGIACAVASTGLSRMHGRAKGKDGMAGIRLINLAKHSLRTLDNILLTVCNAFAAMTHIPSNAKRASMAPS